MTEPAETTTDTIVSPVAAAADTHRDRRLYRALAWVGIVAGILFIIAVVFFSGFFAARASGGYGWHRGWQSGQMQPGSTMGGGCPMMQMGAGGMGQGGMGPGGMGQGGMGQGGMGPGMMGPGMMPGGMGQGGMRGPTPNPTTSTPVPAGQR
ncbi:MAG: hypothetical protein KIH64_012290 [Mycobacterium sp.]|jgi:hypothetical protein|nr:hypothetical protein [Mycobacterium sp.]